MRDKKFIVCIGLIIFLLFLNMFEDYARVSGEERLEDLINAVHEDEQVSSQIQYDLQSKIMPSCFKGQKT